MLQCFFTTSTTELRETAASSGITELGTLLREVIATEKSCDTDEGEAPAWGPSASAGLVWLLPSSFIERRVVHTHLFIMALRVCQHDFALSKDACSSTLCAI